MSELQTITYAVLGVVICDWAFVGRLAAFSDFGYRYWPLTWPRLATMAIAATTAALSGMFFTPGDSPWIILIWVGVFVLWMAVGLDDIARQRALGDRTPPRYSDPAD